MSSPASPFARVLGYSLVAGFLMLGASFAVFAVREFRESGPAIRVRFPGIATLSVGDPVVENGVEAGRVEGIRLEGDAATVVLRLDHDGLPARDARFVNVSHSLMGARKVWIRPGVSPLPLDTSRVQEGVFVPGLPETLHEVRALNDRLAAWREAGDRLFGGGKDGEDGAEVLRAVARVERAFARLAALDASMEGARGALREGVSRLSDLEAKTASAVAAADPGVAAAGRRVATARASAASLDSGLSASLSRLAGLAAALDADTGVVGRLLSDRALYDSLTTGVETLTALARRFRDEGLGDSVTVRPHWGKKNDGR